MLVLSSCPDWGKKKLPLNANIDLAQLLLQTNFSASHPYKVDMNLMSALLLNNS